MKKIILIISILIGQLSFSQSIYKSSIDSGGASASNGNIQVLYTIGEVNVQEASAGNIILSEGFISREVQLLIKINPIVFLQGPAINPNGGEESLMRDDLRVSTLIPTTSPYADGLITNASVFTPTGNDAIVDWIWVELRDKNDDSIVLDSGSALLQRDGDIVNVDGVSPLCFDIAPDNYYIAVNHRNHLGIISASAISLSSTTTMLDFTSSSTSAQGGGNALIDLGTGVFAIYTGDYDTNAQVQNTDATSVIALLGGSGYSNADMDANSQIQNTDVNNLINPNIGKGQQFNRSIVNDSGATNMPVINSTHNIHFTFVNAQNTNDGVNDFYEVDVLIESDVDFKLGSGQLYFNYNTEAFGINISANTKIEYSQPMSYILGEENVLPIYGSFIQNDNTGSRVSLSWQQALSSGAILTDNVTAVPAMLFRIKIEYTNVNEDPMFTFETDGLFLDQTFTACGPTSFATVDCTNFPGEQLLNDTFDSSGATLSNKEVEFLTGFSVYPNPVSEILYISSTVNLNKIELYDVLGKRVLTSDETSQLKVNFLPSGLYFLKVFTNERSATKKIVIK